MLAIIIILFKYFEQNKLEIIISCFTILFVSLIFIFSQTLSKKRKIFSYLRVSFLIWITFIIGLYYGGQISVIHLVNLFKNYFFLAEAV